MQHIIEALVKDIAEQLRPMVAEMVQQQVEFQLDQFEKQTPAIDMADIALSSAGMADIAARIDLADLAKYLNLADLAGELTDSQLTEIAGDIDLSDLAGEIDLDKLTENLDIDEAIRDFFQNNTFSIRS
jgi:hypothetical protein